jgi:hypothetical protein
LCHCSVCVLDDGGEINDSDTSGLRLGGGDVPIQHIDLVDAVIVEVGDGASALEAGMEAKRRLGWGRA